MRVDVLYTLGKAPWQSYPSSMQHKMKTNAQERIPSVYTTITNGVIYLYNTLALHPIYLDFTVCINHYYKLSIVTVLKKLFSLGTSLS